MAEIAAPVLAALGKIGEFLAAPIGQRLGYLFCFNSNVETLKDQLEKLKTMRDGVQLRLEAAARNVETIEPEVQAWLASVNEIRAEAERIIEYKAEFPNGCLNKWCLNFKSRYSESKKAKRNIEAILELQRDGKFERVSCPAPPPRVKSTFPGTSKKFESQELTMNEIIMTLKDDRFNLIGIWGMGGVGKTTMVKEIAKGVMEENLFDEWAMTVVSQKPDFRKMQRDVADMLGLKLDEENLIARAGRLRQRLEGKKILIILDDVWAELDLEDLGVTMQGGNNGCKILFTSRNRGLWRELQTKTEIRLEVLSDEEAWHLFKEKVCDSLDNPDLLPIAKEIVMECGRLPLALVTIGGTLRGKDKPVWKDALRQLGKPCGENIVSGVSAKVYQILKVSYDYLDNEDAKSLFLLCCLFEEDYDIPIEDLVRYGMGLRLFRGISELGQARDRVFALLDQLKGCYLLLDGEKGEPVFNGEYVKMHDLIRDVAISISSKDKRVLVISHGFKLTECAKEDMHERYTCISVISKEIRELPIRLRCPEVELLRSTNCVVETPDSFFEGMGDLKVVDMRCRHSHVTRAQLLFGGDLQMMPQLPSSLQFLKNLQTLSLEECKLENISVIGDLLNLEILSIRHSAVKELPEEIGRLAKLRLLDVTGCEDLHRISSGVISGLVQLEELYMRDTSFADWEGEDGEGINASLREFESLTNLNTIEINIRDAAVLPTIPLFSKLTKFTILMGDYPLSWPDECRFQKHLKLDFSTSIPSRCEISSQLKSTEYLYLEREGSKNAMHELVREGVEGLQHLKYLSINGCETLEFLANTMDWIPPSTTAPTVFLMLESFYLFGLPNLREIFHSPLTMVSFGKLSILEVAFCGKLTNLFQLSIATGLCSSNVFAYGAVK